MDWNDLFRPEFVWIVIGLALLIAEFGIPGLVVFFFGLGALIVGGICFFAKLSLNAQIVVFLVSSVGMLVFLRDSLSRVLRDRNAGAETEDALEYIGERARVTQAISPDALGKVEFHGSQWQAEAAEPVPEGVTVEVVGRDNLTLLVKTVDTA